MQITDQQFIDSLRKSAIENPNRRAPGTYWDAFQNAPVCIVGYALYQIDKDLCPKDNRHLAISLTQMLGCSERVQFAAYCAQAINDLDDKWSEVLVSFEEALALYQPGMDITDVYAPVLENYKRRRGLGVKQALAGNYASGGIIKPMNVSKITMSLNGMTASTSMGYIKFTEFATPTMYQKDHALTA